MEHGNYDRTAAAVDVLYSETLVIRFSSKYHNYIICTTQLRTLCDRLDRLVDPLPAVYYMRDGPEVSYT